MCRYISDIRPMLQVLSGDKLELPQIPLNFSTLNVYYLMKIDDPIVTPVDIEIQQGMNNLINFFIGKGTRTIELDTSKKFYNLRYGYFVWTMAMHDPEQKSILDMLTEDKRSTINPYIELAKCVFGKNNMFTAAILAQGIIEELCLSTIDYQNEDYKNILEKLKTNLHELLGEF